MNRPCNRPFARLALIGALVAGLGLAACGRKGLLDPPPGAAAAIPQEPASPTPPAILPPIGGSASKSSSDDGGMRNGQPVAPKGPKKHIPLDVLID